MNPYRPWVDAIAASLREGATLLPSAAPAMPLATTGLHALIFAPHPDDEVIIGGLPLRLRREAGWRVTNVAVTLGSRPDRRHARRLEAAAACAALGFGLVDAGLDTITPAGRADAARWSTAVTAVAALIERERPALVVLPHAGDWNQTHLGTHLLITDAMAELSDLDVLTVETEFWGAMAAPNLMVESSTADLADLVAALALHVGEVARNPYHLRLPAWMMDNVRRGAELVGGQGGVAPEFAFATLYRLRAWREGGWRDVLDGGHLLAAGDAAGTVIEASLLPGSPAR